MNTRITDEKAVVSQSVISGMQAITGPLKLARLLGILPMLAMFVMGCHANNEEQPIHYDQGAGVIGPPDDRPRPSAPNLGRTMHANPEEAECNASRIEFPSELDYSTPPGTKFPHVVSITYGVSAYKVNVSRNYFHPIDGTSTYRKVGTFNAWVMMYCAGSFESQEYLQGPYFLVSGLGDTVGFVDSVGRSQSGDESWIVHQNELDPKCFWFRVWRSEAFSGAEAASGTTVLSRLDEIAKAKHETPAGASPYYDVFVAPRSATTRFVVRGVALELTQHSVVGIGGKITRLKIGVQDGHRISGSARFRVRGVTKAAGHGAMRTFPNLGDVVIADGAIEGEPAIAFDSELVALFVQEMTASGSGGSIVLPVLVGTH